MTALAVQNFDITPSTWGLMRDMATVLVQSGLLPNSIKNVPQALTVMLKGRELGIPPMQAFAHISVIQGKPAIGAELMLALIRRKYPDAPIKIKRRENDGCTVAAGRPGEKELTDFSFTLEDAKRAGLTGKSSWQGYPRNMCFWRAVSDMARSLYPECLMGCSHTPEELGAEVNEDGEVIDIKPSQTPPKEETPKPAAEPEVVVVPGVYQATPEQKRVLFDLAKDAGIPHDEVVKLKELNAACVAAQVPMENLKAAVTEFMEERH